MTDAQLLDRLRGFGIELDRAGLEALCRDALSAQEVATQLMDRHLSAAERRMQESDWVWLAVLTLWQRWWPAKPCLETIDDKIQEGYQRSTQDLGAATDTWLDAWSDVLQLCDAAGITTIRGFDGQFPDDAVAVQLASGPGDGTGQRGPGRLGEAAGQDQGGGRGAAPFHRL